MNTKREIARRIAHFSKMRVPPTSVDSISSGVLNGKAAAQ